MHGAHTVVISHNDPSKVIEHSSSLSSLCDTCSSDVPANFRAYASYCYYGTVWQAVNMDTLLIFLSFKGDEAVAVATLHRDNMGEKWQEGFIVCLKGHDDEKEYIDDVRSTYLVRGQRTTSAS